MEVEHLNYDGRDRPYSQAVRVGSFVYTSGATISDPGDDIEAQTAKTIEYLAGVLRQAGTDLQHVVRANVFLGDIGEWSRFNEVWKRYFPTDKPTRTTTEVGHFSDNSKVEIDFIAVIPGT